MLNKKQQRIYIGVLCALLAIAGVLYFLWYEDFSNAWVIALGAAYLYLDRYTEAQNEEGK